MRRGAHGARPDLAAQTEGQTQPGIVRWLRSVLPVGSIVAAVPNEGVGVRSKSEAGRARYFQARKAQGVHKGFFDLVCLLPGGRVVLLETKRPIGGVLSVAQQQLHAEAGALGHVHGVCVDPATALAVLVHGGVPLRNVGTLAPRALVLLPPGVHAAKARAPADAAFVRLQARDAADPLPI